MKKLLSLGLALLGIMVPVVGSAIDNSNKIAVQLYLPEEGGFKWDEHPWAMEHGFFKNEYLTPPPLSNPNISFYWGYYNYDNNENGVPVARQSVSYDTGKTTSQYCGNPPSPCGKPKKVMGTKYFCEPYYDAHHFEGFYYNKKLLSKISNSSLGLGCNGSSCEFLDKFQLVPLVYNSPQTSNNKENINALILRVFGADVKIPKEPYLIRSLIYAQSNKPLTRDDINGVIGKWNKELSVSQYTNPNVQLSLNFQDTKLENF